MRAAAPIEGLVSLTDRDLAEFRERLTAARYDAEALSLGESVAPQYLDGLRLDLVHRALRLAATPAAALARLFSYRDAVDAAELRAALGDRTVDALRAAGTLVDDEGGLRSLVTLTPFFGLWVLADPLDVDGDAVMGPGALTLHVVDALPDPMPARVLDLGCGAGSFALLAARRGATTAVGVDLNARAVAMAAVNARLNEVTARFAAGDMTEPVKGERFDLVVTQPPFVAKPPSMPSSTYLHGGDAVTMRMLSAGAHALDAGGVCVARFDAAVTKEPLVRRVRAALGDDLHDVVLLTGKGVPVDVLSIAYASAADPGFGPTFRARAVQYRDHLAESGVTELSSTVARVSRPRGRAGFSAALVARNVARVDHATLEAAWAGFDALTRGPGSILEARLALPPRASVTRVETLAGDGTKVGGALRFATEVYPDVELSDAAAELLATLVTSESVRAAAGRWAEATEQREDEVRDEVLRFACDQIARGRVTVSRARGI